MKKASFHFFVKLLIKSLYFSIHYSYSMFLINVQFKNFQKIITLSIKNSFQFSSINDNSLQDILSESNSNTIYSFAIDSQGDLFVAFGNSKSIEIYKWPIWSFVKILYCTFNETIIVSFYVFWCYADHF
jgi:hypothetical protein